MGKGRKKPNKKPKYWLELIIKGMLATSALITAIAELIKALR